jgi:hypothetical protein
MLLEFKLRNFRSFRGEQTFHFPHPDRAPEHAQVAVVFGPSGAGKTNLILAFAALRELVLHSAALSDKQYAQLCVPFQLGGAEHQTTSFEILVQLDHTRYRYGVTYDDQRIWSERLLVYRTGKPQRWFERQFDDVSQTYQWAAFSPSFNGTRELWRRMTRPKALFLTTAARLESEQLQPLLQWFEQGLSIWFATGAPDIASIAPCVRDAVLKERMLEVLHAVDIPTQDIRIADEHAAGDGPRLELLYGERGAAPLWLDSADEARGTLRLLSLLGPLLPALDQGTVLAVDEFDVGLHPLVARFVVQLVKHSAQAHGRPAQLLLTSHDSSLMVPEILEHDEIWLMERGRDHASCLVPVSLRHPRKRERLARGYLQGRYGAIPRIHLEGAPESVLPQTAAELCEDEDIPHLKSA